VSETIVICNKCKEDSDSPIRFENKLAYEAAEITEGSVKCPHCGNEVPLSKDTIKYIGFE